MLWSRGLSSPVEETMKAAEDTATAAKAGMGSGVVEIARRGAMETVAVGATMRAPLLGIATGKVVETVLVREEGRSLAGMPFSGHYPAHLRQAQRVEPPINAARPRQRCFCCNQIGHNIADCQGPVTLGSNPNPPRSIFDVRVRQCRDGHASPAAVTII